MTDDDDAVRDAIRPGHDLRRLLHHRLFVLGLVLFGIVAIAAILAPLIAPTDPNKLAMRFKFLPPCCGVPVRHRQFRPLAVVAGDLGRAAVDADRLRGRRDQRGRSAR